MKNVEGIRLERLQLKRWVDTHKGAPLCQKAMDWREALSWVLGGEGPLSERLARYNAYWVEQEDTLTDEGTPGVALGGADGDAGETGGSDEHTGQVVPR